MGIINDIFHRVTGYWIDDKWICPDSADLDILETAMRGFDPSYDAQRGYGWVFTYPSNGEYYGMVNGLPLYRTDCTYLVDTTLAKLGYHTLSREVGQQQDDLSEFFCEISRDEAEPGDLFTTGGIHMGVLGNKPGLAQGTWSATVFDATEGLDVALRRRDLEWPVKIWRPKKLVYDIKCDDVKPLQYIIVRLFDPLVLDLDGNGIQTIGTSSGMHFDGDHNGFKELTGWVAPGDGMLMLDINGSSGICVLDQSQSG